MTESIEYLAYYHEGPLLEDLSGVCKVPPYRAFRVSLNKSRTFQRGIRPRWKDLFNPHLSLQQAVGYCGVVRDKS